MTEPTPAELIREHGEQIDANAHMPTRVPTLAAVAEEMLDQLGDEDAQPSEPAQAETPT